MQTDGLCVIIKFLGNTIWSSENDERDYVDNEDEYEPLAPFLRRERDKMIKDLRLYLGVDPDTKGKDENGAR